MASGLNFNISGQINMAGIVVDWRIDDAGNWIVPCGSPMAALAMAQNLSERMRAMGLTSANATMTAGASLPAPSAAAVTLTPEPATAVVTMTAARASEPPAEKPTITLAPKAEAGATKRRPGRPPKTSSGLL